MIVVAIKAVVSFICTKLCLMIVGAYGKGIKVNFPSRFTKNTFIGSNCHFNGMVITGLGKVTIGNNLHSGKNVRMITSFHKYKDAKLIPYDYEMNSRNIVIEDNVWLGENIMILGGVRIGEGAIIQAGSVVCIDVPPLAIAGGHPAIPFAYRDEKHYFKLKECCCFMK